MNRTMITRFGLWLVMGVMALSGAQQAEARSPLSLRNSFPIGTSGVACTALNAPDDPRLLGMFDRGFRLTCRDAAAAVGTLVVLRDREPAAEATSTILGTAVRCEARLEDTIEQVGAVVRVSCAAPETGLDYRRYMLRRGKSLYLVEGLAGYDPVLRLALASVVTNRLVDGEIRVAVTQVSDAAAFARVQAGQLDAGDVRVEAYARNISAQFAEAAEFFAFLAASEPGDRTQRVEALINAGLQQSNLGQYGAAARYFAEAAGLAGLDDAVLQRLLRNFRAMDWLNQGKMEAALEVLAAPAGEIGQVDGVDQLADGLVTAPLAEQLNRDNPMLQRLGSVSAGLSVAERVALLEVQAMLARAAAHRRLGQGAQARQQLAAAIAELALLDPAAAGSAQWLRADLAMEMAFVDEAEGDREAAEAGLRQAIAISEQALPNSPALLLARAQQAAFLARAGRDGEALALYEELVQQGAGLGDGGMALRDLLPPYFRLLASTPSGGARAMFAAAQLLQRPGLARTQAVLARELSAGTDEASSLFRLSVARSREILRSEAEISDLQALAEPSESDALRLTAARQTLASLQADQTALVARLSRFSRYKALAPDIVTLSELQAALGEGEAYLRLLESGLDVYAIFVSREEALAYRVAPDARELGERVASVRTSVVETINGQVLVAPFAVEEAHALYLDLLGPVADRLASVRHLVFEPDGAMLRLPIGLLVTDKSTIERYRQRLTRTDGDEFDMRGIAWLARGRGLSVAVSAKGFLDSRKLPRSRATRSYLGLGENARLPADTPPPADPCGWAPAIWNNPISAAELFHARDLAGAGSSMVRSGQAFSDTALLQDRDLQDYRVVHFATHGLVTPPSADCPAEPALVTSHAGEGSDGLLSFREIFDLRLDADLVILSACNTAGEVSAQAMRAAGVTGHTGFALDGLVRAFVGAGARSVVASHWPVPDDFGATRRLIEGMIAGERGQSLAQSLSAAKTRLMDDPDTSHPFYWAAFIVLGDGAKSPWHDAEPANADSLAAAGSSRTR